MKQKLWEACQKLGQSFGNLLSEKSLQRSLLLLQGIIESQTVNLAASAEALSRRSEQSSTQIYSQYIRYFQTGHSENHLKANFLCIFNLVHSYSTGELVIDRTEWKYGTQWHNILLIGLICGGNLVPLIWQDLGEKRCSDESERIALVKRLQEWWQLTGKPFPSLVMYGDREFIGKEWFKYLIKIEMNFVIRLKENQKFFIWKDGQMTRKAYSTKVLGRYMRRYSLKSLEIIIADEVIIPFAYVQQIENQAENQAEWYLAANIPNVETAGLQYEHRWTVENTFGHCKSKGLHLEDFQLCGSHKLELMISLLSILYALSIHQALAENLMETIPIKTYRDQKSYAAKAVFKVGFERIRSICLDMVTFVAFWMNLWANGTSLGARGS
jgi:Transposase DDE domain